MHQGRVCTAVLGEGSLSWEQVGAGQDDLRIQLFEFGKPSLEPNDLQLSIAGEGTCIEGHDHVLLALKVLNRNSLPALSEDRLRSRLADFQGFWFHSFLHASLRSLGFPGFNAFALPLGKLPVKSYARWHGVSTGEVI